MVERPKTYKHLFFRYLLPSSLLAQAYFKLLKADVECGSSDLSMGGKSNVQECANAVSAAGGTFFIFGKGAKAGNCYHEFTKTASCSDPGSEGFESDAYDFFTIQQATQPRAWTLTRAWEQL